ncbi:UNVERIFIED_CONTAM: hypothetical protein Sradi_6221200 [Sesamum radiatum]|uniref:Retrotransposon gag domain-containing protein n=1 Tax=Sesamum radiatum TaxID=300843 RepID=A0AAW2KAK9_SESRA
MQVLVNHFEKLLDRKLEGLHERLDQMQKERVRNGERPITTWEEMRATMRKRFVPSYYRLELHNHLQRLTQGSKSVDEY